MLKIARQIVANFLWLRNLRRFRTTWSRKEAPSYNRYHMHCRRTAPVVVHNEVVNEAAKRYHTDGCSWLITKQMQGIAARMMERIRSLESEFGEEAVWNDIGRFGLGDYFQTIPETEELLRGDLGDLVRASLGTEFKIEALVGARMQSKAGGPSGSELWHTDGYPGTCIKVLFYLSETSSDNGSMECMDWPTSYEILKRMRKSISQNGEFESRAAKAEFYNQLIKEKYSDRITQVVAPAGAAIIWTNNCIHKGGFQQEGFERYSIGMALYPSDQAADFKKYRQDGCSKKPSFPVDDSVRL